MDEYIELLRIAEVAFRTKHEPPADWHRRVRHLLAWADCKCPEGQGSMNAGIIYHTAQCKARRAATSATAEQS